MAFCLPQNSTRVKHFLAASRAALRPEGEGPRAHQGARNVQILPDCIPWLNLPPLRSLHVSHGSEPMGYSGDGIPPVAGLAG